MTFKKIALTYCYFFYFCKHEKSRGGHIELQRKEVS